MKSRKFVVEVEVTEKSIWLDGTKNLLGSVTEDILQEIIWRRVGNKEPHLLIGNVTEINSIGSGATTTFSIGSPSLASSYVLR